MENEVSHKIIGAAIEVHKILGGAGLLESIYESCLCKELVLQGLRVQSHLAIPINYKVFFFASLCPLRLVKKLHTA